MSLLLQNYKIWICRIAPKIYNRQQWKCPMSNIILTQNEARPKHKLSAPTIITFFPFTSIGEPRVNYIIFGTCLVTPYWLPELNTLCDAHWFLENTLWHLTDFLNTPCDILLTSWIEHALCIPTDFLNMPCDALLSSRKHFVIFLTQLVAPYWLS